MKKIFLLCLLLFNIEAFAQRPSIDNSEPDFYIHYYRGVSSATNFISGYLNIPTTRIRTTRIAIVSIDMLAQPSTATSTPLNQLSGRIILENGTPNKYADEFIVVTDSLAFGGAGSQDFAATINLPTFTNSWKGFVPVKFNSILNKWEMQYAVSTIGTANINVIEFIIGFKYY